MLFEDADDLLLGELFALHVGTSLSLDFREIPLCFWYGLWGYGQGLSETQLQLHAHMSLAVAIVIPLDNVGRN
jgi:hypothetical protein